MSAVLLWAGVGALGGVGAVLRFLVDGLVGTRTGGRLPWGTLVVNLSGTVVLGLLAGAALSGDALLLAGTAALGSYTTFSTWMLESQRLAEDGELWWGAANVAGSLVLGFGAAALGHAIGAAL